MTDLSAPSWRQAELSIDQQLALTTAATRLAAEFDGTYGAETIERFLHSSYEQFATAGGSNYRITFAYDVLDTAGGTLATALDLGAVGQLGTNRTDYLSTADATDTADPWRLRLTDPSYSRVELGVPWVGYPFVADSGWVLLTVPAGAALLLALLAGPPRPTQAVVKPTRAGLPVG